VAANQPALSVFDKHTDIVGRLFGDLLAPQVEHQEQLGALLSRSTLDGSALRVEVMSTGDGAERWLELVITASPDGSGFTVWVTDISEQHMAAEQREHRLVLMERAERVAELGSWEWFPGSERLVWSSNLYRLFGLEPGEITPTLEYVYEQTHPDDRQRIQRVMAYLGQEGHLAPIEYRIAQPGRQTRRLRSTITAVEEQDGETSSIVGAVEDVTDEVGADHKIASHIAVSDALEGWTSLEQGATRLLGDLAEALEMQFGALWIAEGDQLVAPVVWAHPSHDAADLESATRKLRLRVGECLVGRVWSTGEPINLPDIHRQNSFSRCDAARRAGLNGAVAVAAIHDDEVLAVVELLSRDAGRLGRRLMLTLRAIGSELGQFLAHRPADLHPISLTTRQLDVLGLAAQGLTGREIAKRLFISASTVKSHFENIYAKFGVSDRASAVAEAMRQDLIE
jgi:DNA-binding CsgD family transcriptional regulator/PAS domain-containing protein